MVRRGVDLGDLGGSASPGSGEDLLGWLLPDERVQVVVPVVDQSSIASTSCSTLLNVLRRSRRLVSRWNHHSTLGGREPADPSLIRHEVKHANQWAWFGGGAIFPLVYAVSPRPWESQAGLSDGCYQKPSRDGC